MDEDPFVWIIASDSASEAAAARIGSGTATRRCARSDSGSWTGTVGSGFRDPVGAEMAAEMVAEMAVAVGSEPISVVGGWGRSVWWESVSLVPSSDALHPVCGGSRLDERDPVVWTRESRSSCFGGLFRTDHHPDAGFLEVVHDPVVRLDSEVDMSVEGRDPTLDEVEGRGVPPECRMVVVDVVDPKVPMVVVSVEDRIPEHSCSKSSVALAAHDVGVMEDRSWVAIRVPLCAGRVSPSRGR